MQLPAEFLRRGFYFVDTPGLGSAIEENTRTTELYLPEADAFLLVTSFDSPFSEEEMRFFRVVSSSPRRVFVVLNKQDTVNDHERGEALDYVRRKLDATFGQNAPKIFSVSARQVEAKQAHDFRRLEASGIVVLEQELVDFLLSQKRLEFLLRMCDRLADLARAFSASEQNRELAERNRAARQGLIMISYWKRRWNSHSADDASAQTSQGRSCAAVGASVTDSCTGSLRARPGLSTPIRRDSAAIHLD